MKGWRSSALRFECDEIEFLIRKIRAGVPLDAELWFKLCCEITTHLKLRGGCGRRKGP